jgi:hypothetical protein
MKISTNNIGNYSINQVQIAAQRKAAAAKNEELTKDEKSFFIDKYPQKKAEIVDYHFYQKSGSMQGVKLGHLFDKRG